MYDRNVGALYFCAGGKRIYVHVVLTYKLQWCILVFLPLHVFRLLFIFLPRSLVMDIFHPSSDPGQSDTNNPHSPPVWLNACNEGLGDRKWSTPISMQGLNKTRTVNSPENCFFHLYHRLLLLLWRSLYLWMGWDGPTIISSIHPHDNQRFVDKKPSHSYMSASTWNPNHLNRAPLLLLLLLRSFWSFCWIQIILPLVRLLCLVSTLSHNHHHHSQSPSLLWHPNSGIKVPPCLRFNNLPLGSTQQRRIRGREWRKVLCGWGAKIIMRLCCCCCFELEFLLGRSQRWKWGDSSELKDTCRVAVMCAGGD